MNDMKTYSEWVSLALGFLLGYIILIPILERALPQVWRPKWWKVYAWWESCMKGLITAVITLIMGFVYITFFS